MGCGGLCRADLAQGMWWQNWCGWWHSGGGSLSHFSRTRGYFSFQISPPPNKQPFLWWPNLPSHPPLPPLQLTSLVSSTGKVVIKPAPGVACRMGKGWGWWTQAARGAGWSVGGGISIWGCREGARRLKIVWCKGRDRKSSTVVPAAELSKAWGCTGKCAEIQDS